MSTSSKPWVLGLSASHNGAACLLHGDRIAAAVQEERLVGEQIPIAIWTSRPAAYSRSYFADASVQ